MGMAHGYPEACGYLNGYGIHCYVWVTLMPVAAMRHVDTSVSVDTSMHLDTSISVDYIDKCGLHQCMWVH